jgi:rhamnosyltransferase
VFELLRYFNSIDCETIVISNSIVEQEQDKKQIREQLKGKWIERENKGANYGAWQYAMENELIPDDTQFLFLLDDSIFGPLYDLQPIVEGMLANASIDFWGFTDSYEIHWHLQSYFLCFNRKVFTSAVFAEFFKQDFNSPFRIEILQNADLELSKRLIDNGFKGKAYLEYKKLAHSSQHNFSGKDPMHFFVEALLKEYKFPFIKKEFVFLNEENIELSTGILAMLETETNYPVHYIKDALVDKCFVPRKSEHQPLVDVLCHVYYLNTFFRFIIELSPLKKYNCRFVFNLSANLYADPHLIDILPTVFNNCLIIQTSNLGKDIGGKLAMIDLCMQMDEKSKYTVLLHDKQSPHSAMGKTWRKKLFRIIEPNYINDILELFRQNNKIGIVAAKEFIMSEYDKETTEFVCTSNHILKKMISDYQVTNSDFEFVGGTMFWIRTQILTDFFCIHHPLSIRAQLEKGNVLDNNQGTLTHAWERMLSWTASKQGYEITGIHEQI